MELLQLAPCRIRFTHDSISCRFRNGDGINDTVWKIENGIYRVADFPKIEVVHKNGLYYALGNRRLYVYRVLQRRGYLRKIKVYFNPHGNWHIDEFTTKNRGFSIYVRNDVTYPHTSAIEPPRNIEHPAGGHKRPLVRTARSGPLRSQEDYSWFSHFDDSHSDEFSDPGDYFGYDDKLINPLDPNDYSDPEDYFDLLEFLRI